MFSEWDDYIGDNDDILDLVKRYNSMLNDNRIHYFDLDEFENIIDFFLNDCNYKEAVTAINLGFKLHPCSLSLKLKYVHLLIETGKPSKAFGIIRQVEKAEPMNYQLHLLKGYALNITGKNREALKSFERAIDLCDENRDEVAYSIAQSFLQTSQYYIANKFLLLAHQLDSSNVLTLYDLAENLDRLDLPEKSLEYYSKYLDIDPYAEQVWNNMGMLYCRTGRFQQALEAFDYATAINPYFFTAYLNKADALAMQNDYSGAVEAYREILKRDAGNTKALCCLGDCFEEMHKYSEALKTYNHAISLSPDCSEAWFAKGLVLLKIKKLNQSIVAIKKALLYEPDNADYWFMLGEVYSRLHKDMQAVGAYKEAVKINPFDDEAWLACAQVLFSKKKICEAIDILRESYAHINENPTLHYRLAAYHIYQQDFDTAMMHFESGLKLNYNEYHEMFRQFPKTRECGFFYTLIEKHQHKVRHNMSH